MVVWTILSSWVSACLALLLLGSGIHIATNVPGETLFEVGPVDGVPGRHHTTTRASKIISTFTVFSLQNVNCPGGLLHPKCSPPKNEMKCPRPFLQTEPKTLQRFHSFTRSLWFTGPVSKSTQEFHSPNIPKNFGLSTKNSDIQIIHFTESLRIKNHLPLIMALKKKDNPPKRIRNH